LVSPPKSSRKSGIPAIGDIQWGTHVCVFYETKEDLLEINTAYLTAGLESNEFCIWAVSDPLTVNNAKDYLLRKGINVDTHSPAGRIEIVHGSQWYLKGDEVDPKKITAGWLEKLRSALAKGFEGLRISGNAFWIESNHWKEFSEYERELDESVEGKKMIVMCTYSLSASRAVDLLEVAWAHSATLARRNGDWELIEMPQLNEAKHRFKTLHMSMDTFSKNFPRQDLLTARERMVLEQIVRGASSKEVATSLGVSPRTVEFHRLNIMRKLGAKNFAELMIILFGDN
jgi:DNA-binding CsgD family transcriptional regulator